jgi:hypothetical protein
MEETNRGGDWLIDLIERPTRKGVLELAALYLEILDAYSKLSKEYEHQIDDDLAETESTLSLMEKSARIYLQQKRDYTHAVAAVETIRQGIGLEKSSILETAREIQKLFGPKAKIDKQVEELINGLLEMQAKKGRVDILSRKVAVQKIKLAARGETVFVKK